MPTVETDTRTHNTLPDIFRTINGINLDIGPLDRLRDADTPDDVTPWGRGDKGTKGRSRFPRIVLRDALGHELDTFTTLQEAIYRAKWNVKQSGLAKEPLEWRLPKAPLPARPDLTRTFPPLKHPPAHPPDIKLKAKYDSSRVLEFDVEDVGFVRESLQYLPYAPSLSFLKQEILVGPKTYFQIVGTLLLHKKFLSQTEKRHAIYNFPGFCSGCMRTGLCYGCERSSEIHFHEDKPVKTGGGFTYFKKDRPENEMKSRNPINWKIQHPDQALKKLMEEYAGVQLEGPIPDEIKQHLDKHGGHRERIVSNIPDFAKEMQEFKEKEKLIKGDGNLPDIHVKYGHHDGRDDEGEDHRDTGDDDLEGQGEGQSGRRNYDLDPNDVRVHIHGLGDTGKDDDEDGEDEDGNQRQQKYSGRRNKERSRGSSVPKSGTTNWSKTQSGLLDDNLKSGYHTSDDESRRAASYDRYDKHGHRLPKYRRVESGSDEENDEREQTDTEDDYSRCSRRKEKLYKDTDSLHKAPAAFKLKKSPKRSISSKSPFSTDRVYDLPKGKGLDIKKSDKAPTQFKEFRNIDASWKEPKKFELKKNDHKTTKFWSGPPPKKKEKKKGDRSNGLRRVPSPRSTSPDSGLESEFLTVIRRKPTEQFKEKDRNTKSKPLLEGDREQATDHILVPTDGVGIDSKHNIKFPANLNDTNKQAKGRAKNRKNMKGSRNILENDRDVCGEIAQADMLDSNESGKKYQDGAQPLSVGESSETDDSDGTHRSYNDKPREPPMNDKHLRKLRKLDRMGKKKGIEKEEHSLNEDADQSNELLHSLENQSSKRGTFFCSMRKENGKKLTKREIYLDEDEDEKSEKLSNKLENQSSNRTRLGKKKNQEHNTRSRELYDDNQPDDLSLKSTNSNSKRDKLGNKKNGEKYSTGEASVVDDDDNESGEFLRQLENQVSSRNRPEKKEYGEKVHKKEASHDDSDIHSESDELVHESVKQSSKQARREKMKNEEKEMDEEASFDEGDNQSDEPVHKLVKRNTRKARRGKRRNEEKEICEETFRDYGDNQSDEPIPELVKQSPRKSRRAKKKNEEKYSPGKLFPDVGGNQSDELSNKLANKSPRSPIRSKSAKSAGSSLISDESMSDDSMFYSTHRSSLDGFHDTATEYYKDFDLEAFRRKQDLRDQLRKRANRLPPLGNRSEANFSVSVLTNPKDIQEQTRKFSNQSGLTSWPPLKSISLKSPLPHLQKHHQESTLSNDSRRSETIPESRFGLDDKQGQGQNGFQNGVKTSVNKQKIMMYQPRSSTISPILYQGENSGGTRIDGSHGDSTEDGQEMYQGQLTLSDLESEPSAKVRQQHKGYLNRRNNTDQRVTRRSQIRRGLLLERTDEDLEENDHENIMTAVSNGQNEEEYDQIGSKEKHIRDEKDPLENDKSFNRKSGRSQGRLFGEGTFVSNKHQHSSFPARHSKDQIISQDGSTLSRPNSPWTLPDHKTSNLSPSNRNRSRSVVKEYQKIYQRQHCKKSGSLPLMSLQNSQVQRSSSFGNFTPYVGNADQYDKHARGRSNNTRTSLSRGTKTTGRLSRSESVFEDIEDGWKKDDFNNKKKVSLKVPTGRRESFMSNAQSQFTGSYVDPNFTADELAGCKTLNNVLESEMNQKGEDMNSIKIPTEFGLSGGTRQTDYALFSPPLIPSDVDQEKGSLTSQEPDLELAFDDIIDVENLEVDENQEDQIDDIERQKRLERKRRHRHRKHKKRKKDDLEKLEKSMEENANNTEHVDEAVDQKGTTDFDGAEEGKENRHVESDKMNKSNPDINANSDNADEDSEGETFDDALNAVARENSEDKNMNNTVEKTGRRRRRHRKKKGTSYEVDVILDGRDPSHDKQKQTRSKDRISRKSEKKMKTDLTDGSCTEAETDFDADNAEERREGGIDSLNENEVTVTTKAEQDKKSKKRNRKKRPGPEPTAEDNLDNTEETPEHEEQLDADIDDTERCMNDRMKKTGDKKKRSRERKGQRRAKVKKSNYDNTNHAVDRGRNRAKIGRRGSLSEEEVDFNQLPSIKSQLAKIFANQNNQFEDKNADENNSEEEKMDDDAEQEENLDNETDDKKLAVERKRPNSAERGRGNILGVSGMKLKKYRSMSMPLLADIEELQQSIGKLSLDQLKAPIRVPIYLPSFKQGTVIVKKQFKSNPKRVKGRDRSMSLSVVTLTPQFIENEDTTNKSEPLEPVREETLTVTPDMGLSERTGTPLQLRVQSPVEARTNNDKHTVTRRIKGDNRKSRKVKFKDNVIENTELVSVSSDYNLTEVSDNDNDINGCGTDELYKKRLSVEQIFRSHTFGSLDEGEIYNDYAAEKPPRSVSPPKKREIVKKVKKPPPPAPVPVQAKPPTPVKEKTPSPVPVERPASREISFDFVREKSVPELPPIEIPELPEIQERQSEYKGIKKERKLIEVTPELPEQKKKLPPPPKLAPRIKTRTSRKSKVAEAPVTTQELQQLSDPLDFLAKYCIINPDRLPYYERVFNSAVNVQTPRYSRDHMHARGGIVHLPPAQLSEHELNMLKDMTVITHAQSPRRDGVSVPEQYLEKLNYSIEFIKTKQDALQDHMHELQTEKIHLMAQMAKQLDRDIVRVDYKTKFGKKKKKKKKKKKADEPDYDTMGAMGVPKNFRPQRASDITDEVIVSRMDDKMMKKVKKDPAVKNLQIQISRDIEKLKHFDQRVAQIEDEKDLVGLYCMDYYFSEQNESMPPFEFRRQQSRLYQKLHPDPDIEMNTEEVETALQQINNKLLSEKEFQYIFFILDLPKREKINFRLFSIIAALSEKVTQMDPVIRKLINKVDYNALDIKMEKSKELFELLQDESMLPIGNAPAETLAVELTAGGLTPEHTNYVLSKFNREGRGFVDFLDFVTYVPLFIDIHKRIIEDPFNNSLTV